MNKKALRIAIMLVTVFLWYGIDIFEQRMVWKF